MYLREIATHSLLTQQDEVQLAQRMEAGRDAIARLASGEVLDETTREDLELVVQDSERARRRRRGTARRAHVLPLGFRFALKNASVRDHASFAAASS